MSTRRVLVGTAVLFMVAVMAAVQAAQQEPQLAGVTFTVAQAAAGEEAYAASCASCHGENLDDGEFAPPLRGADFRSRWGGQSLEPLFLYIEERMPPTAPGSLTADAVTEVLAHILEAGGLNATGSPLPSDPQALSGLMLPGFVGGPSGGLSGGVTIPPPPARDNPLDQYTPVTDALLAAPPAGEWLTWRRGFDSQGFSPLSQITKENVGNLKVAWTWSLPGGPNESTPLVHDGVLFVHAFGDRVQALDAVTGDLLWQYSHRLPEGVNPSVKRSISLYDDKVYVMTSDTHVVALDATTGRVAWDKAFADVEEGYRATGGPIVAKGKVMVGTVSRNPGGNYIVALDAATGDEAWKFATIAQPGEPFGNSWNGLPLEGRNGGSVWVPGSYDATLNLAYFGVAQTYDTGPLRDLVDQPGVTNDALYTDATVAINPDTGELVWHFQHQPNDQWDLDWAFARVLFEMNVGGTTKTVVATAGKQGIYDVVEADTGRYVSSLDLGIQDIVIGIDPTTGDKEINPRLVPGGGDAITVCPHAGGGKSWIPESYNPNSGVMFVPLVEACMDMTPVEPGGRGSLSTGVRWTLRARPESDGNYGRLQALNLETSTPLWNHRRRAPLSSGVLSTAGGVVFAGALDRGFSAHDDATGEELWSIRLNDVPNSGPISFMVNGKQYVALTVGYGGAQAATFPALVPEIQVPTYRSATIWVFELPD